MTPPVEIAIVAGLSSIVGGLIVAASTYLLNEKSKDRDRQLDFFKLIYAEKVKAVLDLNNIASETFMDLRDYFIRAQDRERAGQLGARLDELLWRAKSYEFLLGGDIVQSVSEYRMVCIRAFLREREFRDVPAFVEGDEWAHEATYKKIVEALRKVVHLDARENLLRR